MRRLSYPRTETQARIVARIEAGWTLRQLEAAPGFPSAPTVRKWAREDPGFAAGLVWARSWRRGVRTEARWAARAFRADWAEDFVSRIRRGEAVGSLVGGPGQPTRRLVAQWRRERPEFDAGVSAAVRLWRNRGRGWRAYDEAVADRIVLMLAHGATLDEVFVHPELPGRQIVRRWRSRVTDFDGAVKTALAVGWRARCRARRGRLDAALTEAICLHVLHGGTVRSAARSVPGAPCEATLYGWVAASPGFAHDLAIARRMRDEVRADEALAAAERRAEAAVQRTRAAGP